MLDRPVPAPSLRTRVVDDLRNLAGQAVRGAWHRAEVLGAIGPRSRAARRFGSFGFGSVVSFPPVSLVNVGAIHLGRDTVIAPYVALSAGWYPGQPDLGERVVAIGDRCLIGRGSSVIAVRSIAIGDDVWTGHNVHLTDVNHGYEDPTVPISRQHRDPAPVVVGDGAWLGHNTVVLPGSVIGPGAVIGAGSVVTGAIPAMAVAAGVPARVLHLRSRGATGSGDGSVRA